MPKSQNVKDFMLLVTVVKQTPRGILVNDGIREEWLPKSQILVGPIDNQSHASIILPRWLAKDKHFI